jgi:prophage regulatory protein
MAEQTRDAARILRRKQVQERIGLSRSTIYLRVAEGNFPKPFSLGARAVGWLESDVDIWIQQQVEIATTSPRGLRPTAKLSVSNFSPAPEETSTCDDSAATPPPKLRPAV